LKAGQLDQRVTIDRLQQGSDEIGQPVTTWAPVFSTWAAVEPLVGREWLASSGAQSEVSTRIRLRYRPGVTSADRVTHEGREYEIVSVIDYKSSHRELVLMCRG
jgi:SPP1 family predicted phage head-tail adaptor